MPRFNHRRENLGYLRGFQMQFWNTGAIPSNLNAVGAALPGFGASLKREIKRHYPAWVELHPFGETLPYAHNRITVDPKRVDRYGVPMLHIDYRIGDNELKMAGHIYDTLEEVGKAAGIEWVHFRRGELDSNGSAIHEHGCCRMGDDPATSVADRNLRVHETANLYIISSAVFVTSGGGNPTLTIVALAHRLAEHLAATLR